MKLRLTHNDSDPRAFNPARANDLGSVHACLGQSVLTRATRRTLGLARTSSLTAAFALAILALGVTGCSGLAEEWSPEAATRLEATEEGPSAVSAGGDDIGDDVEQGSAPSSRPGTREAELSGPAPSAGGSAASTATTAGDKLSGVTSATLPAGAVQRATMTTSGRQLLDSCGNPFVTRGVEQIFGEQLPEGNDWVGLVEQIASSGVNAVRVLAGTDSLDVANVDAVLEAAGENGLVVYVTPYGDENRRWLEGADVRAMLAKHEKYIIIDAFGEPTFDDRARFLSEATGAIAQVRSWGYRVPLTVTANQYGRDLPSLLELGGQIVASDPLGNTVLGWQAYWGQGGYYEEAYGLSLTEAVQAAANAPFPIQLGLDRITDFPSDETADFGALMSATEANDIGWLWWDWYNPYGNENNLTEDGSFGQLTATGQNVVSSHPASIQNTSRLACAAAGNAAE